MPDLKERTINESFKIIRQSAGDYLCHSGTRTGIVYCVNIEAHGALGHCTCDDFEFRRYPQWKKVRANYDFLRCKHLRAVRNHVLDQMIYWKIRKDAKNHNPRRNRSPRTG